jgi:hypothetical protein
MLRQISQVSDVHLDVWPITAMAGAGAAMAENEVEVIEK